MGHGDDREYDDNRSLLLTGGDGIVALGDFEDNGIPKLDKMSYDEVVKLIAEHANDIHNQKDKMYAFGITFLMESYLIHYRKYDDDTQPFDVMLEVSDAISNTEHGYDNYTGLVLEHHRDGEDYGKFDDFEEDTSDGNPHMG